MTRPSDINEFTDFHAQLGGSSVTSPLKQWFAKELNRLKEEAESAQPVIRTEAQWMEMLRRHEASIAHVPEEDRTPAVCMAAVIANAWEIRLLNDAQRTEEICLAAVQRWSSTFEVLTEEQRTPEVCKVAVRQNPQLLLALNEAQRTPDVCMAAVKGHGWLIGFLTDARRTPEVCMAAVQSSGLAVHHLTSAQRTPEVCLAAVQQDGLAIWHLTPEQCAQRQISDWIMENWEQCAKVLGKERAQEVAQAIQAAREGGGQTERAERMGS